MAEISQAQPKSGKKVRVHKLSTKIDMTPMVDLAFLLLTFFILTTTFNKPQIMQVNMPDKPNTGDLPPELQDKNAFNLVLDEKNKIYYWIGVDGEVQRTDYRKVRKLLQEEMTANTRVMFLIKPADKSKFENIVDILDEISITGAERFAIVDFTKDDRQKIDNALN